MLAVIPDFGSIALISGYIIDLHYFPVRVQAGIGYFNFEDIFQCSACHASCFNALSNLKISPHSNSDCFNYFKIASLSPFGAIHTPRIFDTSCA